MARSQQHRDQRDQMASSVRSTSVRLSNPNIFSDEFALEPLNVSGDSSPVSQQSRTDIEAAVSSDDTTPQPSVTTNRSQLHPHPELKNNDGFAAARSFTQPGAGHPSPNLRRNPSVASTTSNTTSNAQRSMSTSSRFSLPRAQSPYTGATGPSHPYAMYPQVTRNSSVTTASTVRPAERPFVGGAGPEHPYAMYPQNTVAEEEDTSLPVPGLPVGFPGMGQNYQRRLRQEGEDVADIIGPDGHTEQLPPYSRYPDYAAAKSGVVEPASALDVPDATVSADPPMSPQSRMSSRTMFSETNVELNTAAARTADNDASGSFKERLKKKGKRRVCCGIPLWVFGLFLFVLLGIVIGGVIGGVVGSQRGAASSQAAAVAAQSAAASAVVTATVTSWLDATSVPTPPNLPPIPLGNFNIPTNSLKVNSNNCIVGPTYNNAWGCMGSQGIGVTTSVQPGGVAQVVFEPQTINSSFTYGPQPPDLGTQPFSLALSADKDATNLGPALFFFDMYDKIVILPPNAMDESPSKRSIHESELFRRDGRHQGPGMRRQTAEVGDRPWFCFWNQTVVEFFIYLTQNTTEFQNGWDTSSSSAVVNTQSLGAVAASTSTSEALSSQTTAAPTSLPSPRSYHGYNHKRGFGASNGYADFPRFIKLEEKRVPRNNPQPYCQQMQILADGSIVPAGTANILIEENDNAPAAATSAAATSSATSNTQAHRRSWFDQDLARRQSDDSTTCCCEWLST